MMGGSKRERRDGEGPAVAGELTAFLDKGSRFEGKLYFEGHVRLNGQFKGDIRADGSLIIGEGAAVDAHIAVGTLVVAGSVVGDIVAASRVELHPPGRVVGNITTPVLVVQEGSVLEGQCHMQGLAAAGVGGPDGGRETPLAERSADLEA